MASVGDDLPPLTPQEAARVRQRIVHLFTKLHALTVPVDAVSFLLDVFRIVPPDQIDNTLGIIIASYEQQNGACPCGPAPIRATRARS